MSRVRGPRRLSRLGHRAPAAVAVTVLSLTASGCVVVHGEREVLPATTPAEAARALEQFTAAYNRADRAYDSSLDADYVTGALGAIDAARLKAGRVNNPGGNSAHRPLTLTDARFTIPKKAGWPRWFVADAKGNKGGNVRWLLVFLRYDLGEKWKVAYLTLVAPGKVPEFKKDADGLAEAVPANTAELALAPRDMSRAYATYLQKGGETFAPGAHTTRWREVRAKNASRPGLARQYIDQPMTDGPFAPLALRTADGGALVFFTTRHYEKQTAAQGTTVPTPDKNVRALATGEIRQSLTMEFISNQVALAPPRSAGGSGGSQVSVLARVQGLTSARGE
ncbi:hypothetical protein ACFQWA_07230 [Streptomyces thermogriseus]|jgi:hypothetical protein|uniref:hypothetical protein n=1 Tax=Streptomyces thermogriseus TaxID=75292 RepID=UPI0031F8F6FF